MALRHPSPITAFLGTVAADGEASRWLLQAVASGPGPGLERETAVVQDPGTAAGLDLILGAHATAMLDDGQLAAVGIERTALNRGAATPVDPETWRAVVGEVQRWGRGQALAAATARLVTEAIAGSVDAGGRLHPERVSPFAHLAGRAEAEAHHALLAYAAELDDEARRWNRAANRSSTVALAALGLVPTVGLVATPIGVGWAFFFEGRPTDAELTAYEGLWEDHYGAADGSAWQPAIAKAWLDQRLGDRGSAAVEVMVPGVGLRSVEFEAEARPGHYRWRHPRHRAVALVHHRPGGRHARSVPRRPGAAGSPTDGLGLRDRRGLPGRDPGQTTGRPPAEGVVRARRSGGDHRGGVDRPLAARAAMRGRKRRSPARPAAGRTVLVLLAILLALTALVVVVVAPRSSVIEPEPEVVLTIPTGRVAGGVALGDSVIVALSEETDVFGGRTQLVRLDLATGAELERVTLADWSTVEGLAVFDGDLVLRLRGRLAGVPGSSVRWFKNFRVSGEFWLTIVDGDTLQAIQQYQLPPLDWGSEDPLYDHEPLVVIDDVYWGPGSGLWGGRIRVDLRSGETWAAGDVLSPPVHEVFPWRDRMVVVMGSWVRVEDVATNEIVHRFYEDDYPRMVNGPGYLIAFRAHEGEVWATNIWEEQDGFPLRLDLETGDLVEGQPSTSIPAAAFTSGGHRLELLRDHPVAPFQYRPSPEPGDRWRRVDPDTYEVLDTFDLGPWRLMFATPDHLWVTAERDQGPGVDLARIPLVPPTR